LWEAPFERKGVQRQGGLGAPVAHLRAMLKQGADPFDAMLVTCAALAALEPRVEGSIESAKSRAPLLARRVIAAAGLVRGADAVTASLEADSAARALVVALGARATTSAIDALDEALVLLADHELNASTFAVRVAASTGASLAAAVVAGLAAVSGPRHGAATARVEAFLDEVGKPERASAAAGPGPERGDAVPGFGHPLYPNGDPRGEALLATAARLGARSREVKTMSAIVSAMQLAAREKPTVDVGIVALSAALGLRRGAPL